MMDDSFLGFLGFLDFCEVAFEWRGQEFRKTPIGRLCCFRLVLHVLVTSTARLCEQLDGSYCRNF